MPGHSRTSKETSVAEAKGAEAGQSEKNKMGEGQEDSPCGALGPLKGPCL